MANSEKMGGRGATGANVKSGLSEQAPFDNESNKSCGLDTNGRNQTPVTDKRSVNSDRGNFKWK